MRTKAFTVILAIMILVGKVSLATAQLAPSGEVVIQSGSSHYLFISEGSFMFGTTFVYVDYVTGESDSISPSVSFDGTFSGVSDYTGRTINGQIQTASITFTYNGVTLTGPKASAYGQTKELAGRWLGIVFDPINGGGFGEAIIDSQGHVIVLTEQGFVEENGFGTIDANGNFSVPLLSGTTVSGVFSPIFGRFQGSFNASNGGSGSLGLLRTVPSRLLNISTRGVVGTGEQVLIGGFIVGEGGKTVLIDAKGPSLAAQGVANPVQSTKVDLYVGAQLIASNDGWRNNSNVSEIAASGLAPTDDRESALQVALEPGAYTVIVSSGDGTTGVGLVEVYGVGDTFGP